MKRSPSIETLIQYQRGQLTVQERQEVDQFIEKHPHYQPILRGIELLRMRKGDDSIELFLQGKKDELIEKLFPQGPSKH